MAYTMTLQGSHSRKCKCIKNPRTGKRVALCHVGKSGKSRSGWMFVKSKGVCER